MLKTPLTSVLKEKPGPYEQKSVVILDFFQLDSRPALFLMILSHTVLNVEMGLRVPLNLFLSSCSFSSCIIHNGFKLYNDEGASLKKIRGFTRIFNLLLCKQNISCSNCRMLKLFCSEDIMVLISMTSLLLHSFAHSTKHSFRRKTKNNDIKKFLIHAATCVKVIKN